jgi:hypothetical protein
MAAARKTKSFGWGVAAVLLLVGAAVSYGRPAPTQIPEDQLVARSLTDAQTIAGAIPAKFADRHLSLQNAGPVSAAVAEVAGEDGVSDVRVWSPSGALLAASDANDPSAATSAVKTLIVGAHGAGAQEATLSGEAGSLRVFEPVLPDRSNAVVAEIVRSTQESGLPFKAIAAGLGVAGGLALIIAVASLFGGREKALVPAVTAGVAEGVTSEPQPGEPAIDRAAERLAQKLKTSEASKAAMETQMEQLRAQLRMGRQGSEQAVADLDHSLASSQHRVHEAGENLLLAEARAKEAEERAAAAEEALSRATPSDASARVVTLESEIAAARRTIAELEGAVAEHQARTRDAEARAGEAEKQVRALGDQGSDHAAKLAAVEARERELEDRLSTAKARATQAESDAVSAAAPDTREVEARAVAAEGALAQLQLELARAKDLEEQALEKLEASESRAAASESKANAARKQLEDAESRARDAETRAAIAGAPGIRRAPNTVAPPRRTPDTPPPDFVSPVPVAATPATPATPASTAEAPPLAEAPASEPAAPDEATVKAVEDEGPSATDPGAWKALAKTLRRNALGEEAGDEPEEEEPEEPAGPMTEDDRSELRARLARASAKKRRKAD